MTKHALLAALLLATACAAEPGDAPAAAVDQSAAALGYWELAVDLTACNRGHQVLSIDLERDGALVSVAAGRIKDPTQGVVVPMVAAGAALGRLSASVMIEDVEGARWDAVVRDGGIDPGTHEEHLDATVSWHGSSGCAVTVGAPVVERVR